MADKRQIKFEASEEFYRKLQNEKQVRDLSIQEIATRAIERYCAVPEKLHKELDAQLERLDLALSEALISAIRWRLGYYTGTTKERVRASKELAARKPSPEMKAFVDLDLPELVSLYNIISGFPAEKIRLVKEMLLFDLKYYRSARIKDQDDSQDTQEQA
jgi:hypothetical protein